MKRAAACFILIIMLMVTSIANADTNKLDSTLREATSSLETTSANNTSTFEHIWGQYYKEPDEPLAILKHQQYKKLKYKDIARSPYAYSDKPTQFTGYVWGFDTNDSDAFFVICVGNNTQDNPLLCFAKDFSTWKLSGKSGNLTRLLPNDKVTVYGYVYGEAEADLKEASFQAVPLFRVDLITIFE